MTSYQGSFFRFYSFLTFKLFFRNFVAILSFPALRHLLKMLISANLAHINYAQATMQDGAKEFKKRVTQALKKANDSIEEAYKLLSINEGAISVDHFINKISDLLIDKEKLYELEEEIPSIVEDDDETSPEEKQQILKSLKDHVIPSIRKLVKEIEEAIGHLERRVSSMRTKTHTWSERTRAPGEQSTINNKDAPSSKNQPQRSRSMSPRVSPTHRQERNTQASDGAQQGAGGPGMNLPSSGNKRLEDKFDTLSSFVMLTRGNVCNTRSAPTSNDSGESNNEENDGTYRPYHPSGGFNQDTNARFQSQQDHSEQNQQSNNQRNYSEYNGHSYGNRQTGGANPSESMATIMSQGLSQTEMMFGVQFEQMKASLATSAITAIPKFSGEQCDYSSFMAHFDSLVHNNIYIDVKMKQTILCALLPQALAREHQSAQVSAEGYNMLRKNLERQFNRKKLQSTLLINEIQAIMFPEDDIDKLRSALNTFSTLSYKLQALGIDPNHEFYIRMMVEKLPKRVGFKAYEKILTGNPTLEEVLVVQQMRTEQMRTATNEN
ncbi:hypothetical protein CAEBREN_21330 [Caenorhabditis brenneri]|uniref:Uncharacterized protein n=1 Tax=Caenorhabditis brenneri TaxID=135651 RepID=G0PJ42_CAEBE|nr:hypothetical protein CAEBREN_21330 [Caenorhabditis brenneri]